MRNEWRASTCSSFAALRMTKHVQILRGAQDDKHVQILRGAQDDKHVQILRCAQDDKHVQILHKSVPFLRRRL